MSNEIETSFNTEAEVRITVDQYDGGVWLSLQGRRAMMSAVMTRAEAERAVTNPCTVKQARTFASVFRLSPQFDTEPPRVLTLRQFAKLPTQEKLWRKQS